MNADTVNAVIELAKAMEIYQGKQPNTQYHFEEGYAEQKVKKSTFLSTKKSTLLKKVLF